MCRKPIRLGVIILALGASAGAVPSNSAPLPVSASAQNSASPQSDAPAQSNALTKAGPTPAQLEQPGAVVMAPPILRNTGRTSVPADQPLFGALNLQGQASPRPLGEQPPAMPPAPSEAAIGGGAGGAAALGPGHD